MTIKMQNMMFNHTLSSVPRLFVLSSIMLVGLAMSSCSSSDDPASQGTGAEGNSSATNTGIALNNLNADILQASVKSFTRGEVPEQELSSVCTPAFAPATSDNGLTCDVAWSTSATTRASDTGYNLQWGSIGSATQIAIQPRAYAATSYSTYNVSTSGNISASSPYYFESATDDVITSWYPYNSGSLSSFTVQTNQSAVANYIASDLLYTSQTVNAASQSLTYSHKMAQVIVDVTVSNANYLTNSEIQTLTIAGLKTNCTTDFTSFSGNVVRDLTFTTTDASSGDIKAYRYSNSSTSTTSTATFILCVPAQTIATTQTFTVTVGGTAYTGKLTTAQTLASGSAYNISITFDGKATMVYPSGNSIAVGDYYSIAANGQAVVVKNASISSASSKGITPIAVVFSTSTSSTDSDAGYKLGYALSLKFASQDVQWATSLGLTESFSATTTPETCKSNKDGRTETLSMNNSSHPAAQAALTYSQTKPKAASVWFLPSCGQFYDIIINLCGMSASDEATSGASGYIWSGYALQGLNAINVYLNAGGGDPYDIDRHTESVSFNQTWSSSYRTGNEAHNLTFQTGGGALWIESSGSDNYKTNREDVRPAIAF